MYMYLCVCVLCEFEELKATGHCVLPITLKVLFNLLQPIGRSLVYFHGGAN